MRFLKYLPSKSLLFFILLSSLTLQLTSNISFATHALTTFYYAAGYIASIALSYTLPFFLIDCYLGNSSDRQERNDG